ncbi:MAG TPA: hypothetical protein VK456_06670 [Xanthobacteraceae bacterium]|nr:hypothetical protein [Xanthobacteraceae bacterium]
MTNASRALSLPFALAFAIAATTATPSASAARAATHPPAFASETGWPGELVNRPGCGTDGDYDTRAACEAGRR